MAYVLTHFWPGGTEEEYRTTLAAVTEASGGTRPEAIHVAGPTEGGFFVVGVYDSKDVGDRFVQESIMPLMPIDGGLAGPPQERSAEIVYSEGIPG